MKSNFESKDDLDNNEENNKIYVWTDYLIKEKISPMSLKSFISNNKKFSFCSAFDRRGAKSFLKSKEKALKEIEMNEKLLDKKFTKKASKKKSSRKTINESSKKSVNNSKKGNTLNVFRLKTKSSNYVNIFDYKLGNSEEMPINSQVIDHRIMKYIYGN